MEREREKLVLVRYVGKYINTYFVLCTITSVKCVRRLQNPKSRHRKKSAHPHKPWHRRYIFLMKKATTGSAFRGFISILKNGTFMLKDTKKLGTRMCALKTNRGVSYVGHTGWNLVVHRSGVIRVFDGTYM